MRIKITLFLLALFCLTGGGIMAQTLTAEGVVRDEHGKEMVGASVFVKGTQKGMITDSYGRFKLANVRENDLIIVTFIGYKSVEEKARPHMSIVLHSEAEQLEDVVVVAFGEQKRSAFTGSAGVIDSEKLSARQVTNVMDVLQGQVAGVQMVSTSGSPDSTPTIRIRGFGSIMAGGDPLVIVDGIPYDGGWNNINPNDVESLTVLKDASSTALYGARGANGVIMITTKRAKAGSVQVTLDAKWGSNQRAAKEYDYITDPGQYLEAHYSALNDYYMNGRGMSAYAAHVAANNTMYTNAPNGGLGYIPYTVPDGEYLIGDNGKLNPHAVLGNRVYYNGQIYTILPDNWLDETYRKSFRQEYNLSISGGTEKMQTYASLGYLNNEGIVSGSNYERYSARLKTSWQANNWLKISGGVNYSHYVSDGVEESDSGNVFYLASLIAPIYPVYLRDGNGNIMTDSNGKLYDYGDGMNGGLLRPQYSMVNSLKDNQLNTGNKVGNSFLLNGAVDFTPVKGLKITLNGSVTDNEYRSTSTLNPFYGYGAQTYPTGVVSKYHQRVYSLNFQQIVNYSHSFGLHNMSLMAGHENYKYNYDYLYGSKSNMFSFFENQELSGAIVLEDTNSYMSEYFTEGYFFRGMYDYREKYFFSASYRRDASSRFHPDHRWGNFYSFGAAWILTEEPWLKTDWLNMLKLKVSFGQQGNDSIGEFLYTDTFTIENSGGNVSLVPYTIGNPDITWETNSNINAGFEFELFSGRIRGSVDYFHRKTTDMLSFVQVALSAGYAGYYSNIGDMLNKGIELDLSVDVLRTRGFLWNVNLNLTHYKNRIVRLSEYDSSSELEGYSGYQSSYYFYGEGLPIYSWALPKYAGVSDEGLSQWYYTDGDGNLQKTTSFANADTYLCGAAIPDMYGGFGTTLSWKGFDLSVGFSYSIGGKVFDLGYQNLMGVPSPGNTGMNIHKDVLKGWSTANPDSDIPRFRYNDVNTNAYSDRFLIDGSWLSLQNINFGYTLPAHLTRKLGLTKVRVYFACDNVTYWSKRDGLDPRMSLSGLPSSVYYSPIRTVSGGVTFQF